ncbi:nucleotidyl transferase AbiEii/AbiGii toxin family protein [Rhizobium sullae]|uniref:Nucleotidyltransferase AbiEii toxin of type IV toxin-antitoxin system n=1 Tax=Rhizobium sullae TaxID=50338 RepID=A0A4R3PSW3_RHISU|nr:nucleotidyl transferase AbiEii/AbiGii toxin family protein [Rhizobium sullae]TCU08679.1 nucleotidyltransferase AbiEii toxin of type IV toxin-antitoxin system [Rhizobium sullae]
MPTDFLHNHKDFGALLRIVAEEMKVQPVLVEKDYWIMHCLYGLQQLKMRFELKGGTSLSKGYRIINRFSEDIDIRIEPPEAMGVKTGPNHDKPAHREGRKAFYDWLAETITIDGIKSIERDTEFDNESYRSGGIRLYYPETTGTSSVLKDGVLLEAGFDTVAPNIDKEISSWAYDYASSRVELVDNRAFAVPCYEPGYTLVEKLQTISTKFRKQQETGQFSVNFLRHYYDVYCLLEQADVQAFIGTEAYLAHKERRFPKLDDPDISRNPAFGLSDPDIFRLYERAYERTAALYYHGRPSLREIIARFASYAERL